MSLLELHRLIHEAKRMEDVRIRAEKIDAILNPSTRLKTPV